MQLDPHVSLVEGHDDILRFRADIGFTPDAKALTEDEYAKYMEQLEEGDLLIAGWGANLELDRDNEAFLDGAFTKGLRDFLAGEATLAYHHKHDIAMGKVLDAIPVDGKGVKLVARVDSQPESSPIRHLYEQVKKGTLNALSCGGFFKRVMTDNGPRISEVDLTEWSITPVPVGRGANFAVVGAKALEGVTAADDVVETPHDEEIKGVLDAIAALDEAWSRRSAAAKKPADVL